MLWFELSSPLFDRWWSQRMLRLMIEIIVKIEEESRMDSEFFNIIRCLWRREKEGEDWNEKCRNGYNDVLFRSSSSPFPSSPLLLFPFVGTIISMQITMENDHYYCDDGFWDFKTTIIHRIKFRWVNKKKNDSDKQNKFDIFMGFLEFETQNFFFLFNLLLLLLLFHSQFLSGLFFF